MQGRRLNAIVALGLFLLLSSTVTIIYSPLIHPSNGVEDDLPDLAIPKVVNSFDMHVIIEEKIQKAEQRIPKRLILSDKANVISEIMPISRRQNTLRTIQKYQDAFQIRNNNQTDDSTYVWYYNDADCHRVLTRVEKRLADYFLSERVGPYKADLCRLAALYERGGYYIDTDMEIIGDAIVLPPHITLATVRGLAPKAFFQSFLAAAPRHPVIKKNMDLLVDHYRKRKYGGDIGTFSLHDSYEDFVKNNTEELQKWPIDLSLKEVHWSERYGAKRRIGSAWCNFLVINSTENKAYFYSRVLGSGTHCN